MVNGEIVGTIVWLFSEVILIAIVNISTHPEPFGVHEYSVRINKMEICQFKHKREDGLAACILAAAKAVEANKWANAKHIIFDADRK